LDKYVSNRGIKDTCIEIEEASWVCFSFNTMSKLEKMALESERKFLRIKEEFEAEYVKLCTPNSN